MSGRERLPTKWNFIADNGAWRVLETSAVGQSDDSGFGFSDDSPGAPADAGLDSSNRSSSLRRLTHQVWPPMATGMVSSSRRLLKTL